MRAVLQPLEGLVTHKIHEHKLWFVRNPPTNEWTCQVCNKGLRGACYKCSKVSVHLSIRC